jgi:hypothetical protein
VKGEEFDHVIVYVPRPTGNQICPSIAWWDNAEERRVAFVAASRAKKGVTLILHQQTHSALIANRPSFLENFQTAEPLEP